ncbi:hypothetical protein J6Y73_02365 [bacterium]|nr:hypothetical protein [bacterium]
MLNISKINQSYSYEGEHIDFQNCFIDYPSPKLQRVPFLSLNGRYKLEINKSTLIPSKYSNEIMIPYPFGSLLNGYLKPIKKKTHYHLHKEFVLDDNNFNQMIFLNILRIEGEFVIYINGQYITKGADQYEFKAEFSDCARVGNNTLDIDLMPTDTENFGITGQVYIDSTGRDYIRDINIETDIDEQSVTFDLDTDSPIGTISITSPNGLKKQYRFKDNRFTLFIDDFIVWDYENPFFYQYEIKTQFDKIKGIFSILNYRIGESDGYRCFLVNNKPMPIKGILDNYYYSDGLTVMPSFSHCDKIINEIKKIGFNSIFITERIELPYYYYNLEIKGILSAVEIKYKTHEQALKEINYLEQFNINYLFVINNLTTNIKNEDIYNEFKPLLNDRIVIVKGGLLGKMLNRSYGDLDTINNPAKLVKPTKKYLGKNFLTLDLSFKNNYAENFVEFIRKSYIKASMHGLIGYYFSSLNNPKDGIFTENIKRRANNSKIIIKYL